MIHTNISILARVFFNSCLTYGGVYSGALTGLCTVILTKKITQRVASKLLLANSDEEAAWEIERRKY
jgi:hypothetical protein